MKVIGSMLEGCQVVLLQGTGSMLENIEKIVKIENIETLSKILKKSKISASLPMYEC